MSNTIYVFTDGSCANLNNEKNGGWAFVIVENGKEIYSQSGAEYNTTNNKMEIKAVIEALKTIKDLFYFTKVIKDVVFFSDSQLVTNTLCNNPSFNPKKNIEEWNQAFSLLSFLKNEGMNIDFTWIKGHDKSDSLESKFNKMADKMAQNARKSITKRVTMDKSN